MNLWPRVLLFLFFIIPFTQPEFSFRCLILYLMKGGRGEACKILIVLYQVLVVVIAAFYRNPEPVIVRL